MEKAERISEIFASMVFSEDVMRERLPKEVYKSLINTIANGKEIDASIADVVAGAMKDWAIEKGATHFTHWFQPLTGVTAEKHDAFLTPVGHGKAIMEFSGKELIKGEPDASSFPSGGLRATFEARGYTAWDPASYAFIKDGSLYIPTAFCSYTGEALDTKTPLLRSMDAINNEGLRILRLFGDNQTTRITTTVGAEQEYFLIDERDFKARRDLFYCGRTLFGAPAVKGQELDDHYFGVLPQKVNAFMQELDRELWKLGISSKTKHNEAAPAQHELAPIYSTTNIAVDQNLLTMEFMKRLAPKYGMACLLAEKPFEGINGSGKHNNWSLGTDTGINLLKPGKKPMENKLFLITLAAVIKAVDDYQELLRISAATAGNDCRLGGHEAPPAIISIFLGDELEGAADFDKALDRLLARTFAEHKRILFSGNSYSKEWEEEAKARGLASFKTSPEAYEHFTDKKNVELFGKFGVMSEVEMRSRREIFFESYRKIKNIEAKTMLEMTARDIIPAVSAYIAKLSEGVNAKRAAIKNIDLFCDTEIIEKLSAHLAEAYSAYTALERAENNAAAKGSDEEAANYYRTSVNPKMEALRAAVDAMEILTAREFWPMPTYGDITFRINQ